MAQDTWINIAGDKSASRKQASDQKHSAAGGTAAAGDLTVSYDSAVVTNLTTLDTMLATVRARAIAGGLK